MQTDTFGQLLDRIVIARLKSHHHRAAGSEAVALVLDEEAEMLARAADDLVALVEAGEPVPPVKLNTRFHDHMAIEGQDVEQPLTVWLSLDGLVKCHANYWLHQGQINEAKAKLVELEQDSSGQHLEERHGIEAAMVRDQRVCDNCNQIRNQLIQQADELWLASIGTRS